MRALKREYGDTVVIGASEEEYIEEVSNLELLVDGGNSDRQLIC